MSDHDPGDLYEPPPRSRREYNQEDEYDDAWAAGDAGNVNHPGISSEDRDYGIRQRVSGQDESAPDLGPLPPRRRRSRPAAPADPRTSPYYDPDQLYADSPSYRRSRGVSDPNPGPPPKRKGLPKRKNSPSFHMPYWEVLLLVILGVMALFAVTLAIVSVLVL